MPMWLVFVLLASILAGLLTWRYVLAVFYPPLPAPMAAWAAQLEGLGYQVDAGLVRTGPSVGMCFNGSFALQGAPGTLYLQWFTSTELAQAHAVKLAALDTEKANRQQGPFVLRLPRWPLDARQTTDIQRAFSTFAGAQVGVPAN